MGGVGIDEMRDAVRLMGETLAEVGRAADPSTALRAMDQAYQAGLAPVG
jgi:hypothetical protein